MPKPQPRQSRRSVEHTVARRRHRLSVLKALLAICRRLEAAQGLRPSRLACGDVASMLDRLIKKERAMARK